MATGSEEWSVNSNEAVSVSLVQPSSSQPRAVTQFQPQFTYPIFGEAEQIFGYKNLNINLRFAAHDLRPSVEISYDKKFTSVGSTHALDINKILENFLPPVAFERDFDSVIQNDTKAKDWTPPGEKVESYTRNGETYEIWAASLSDPIMKELIDNIQIFLLFFIEGAVFINLDDVDWTLDRWRVYLVYKKEAHAPTPTASPYSFVGYATTYRFYKFQAPKSKPKASNLDPYPSSDVITPTLLSSRLRISQFLILPKYQRGGHGSALYKTIYSEVMKDDTVSELTVEDPSEEFDKLRDVNDFQILRPAFEKAGVKINTETFANSPRGSIKRMPTSKLLPIELLKQIRIQHKIAPRQFSRQTEMFLLSQVGFSHRALGGANMTTIKIKGARASDPNDRAYYWWRLLLKQRIARKNKDLLLQVSLEDRISHIEDTVRGQEDEYEGMLVLYALQNEKAQERSANGAAESSTARKRKVIDDDEDEEMDDIGSKRSRVGSE